MPAGTGAEWKLQQHGIWNKEGREGNDEEKDQQKDDEDGEKKPTKECENEQEEGMHSIMTFETINVTSAHTDQKTILEREAHVQLCQEHCLTPAQIKGFQALAFKGGERFEGGPLDPEHGRSQRV